MNTWRKSRRPGVRFAAGFTLIELAIVVVVAGLLLVPLLRMAGSAMIAQRFQETQSALETARDSLIAFAAAHGGCLPFASDTEGGVPDTDHLGNGGNLDTGDRIANRNAGDLPWAELGLTNAFVDGDGLRIQYYVASPYTDKDSSQAVIECNAAFRGVEWDPNVTYQGSGSNKLYVYWDDGTGRSLWEIKGTLPAGTTPLAAGSAIAAKIGVLLLNPLLELRRGPNVTAAGSESDVISAQNVFVLIAPGKNRNTALNRLYVRDSTHVGPGGAAWPIQPNPGTVNGHIFSNTQNFGAGDAADNGDDTLLVMSFNEFKLEMSKYGLNMEPICDTSC